MTQDKLSEVRRTLEGFKAGPLILIQRMLDSEHCFFEVPLIILCYLDYLASLYFGCWSRRGASARLRDFIRHWLGQLDEVYIHAAPWLVHIFRHGTVHEFKPKDIEVPSGVRVSWMSFLTEDELNRAGIHHLDAVTYKGRRYLPLALDRFRADFCRTIDLLLREATECPEVLERMWAAIEENNQPEPVKEGEKFTRDDIQWLSGCP